VVAVGLVAPFSLPGATVRTPLLDASAGAAVLRIPGVAEYLVRSDGSMDIAPASGTTERDVACFRDGPVAALAVLLQGGFPLRAAAIATGAGGLVLCGPSAVGKSSAAAALALRGNAVLADKVVVVTAPPAPSITGTAADVELWPPMAGALGLDPSGGEPVRPALEKRVYRLGLLPRPERVPASLIVVLDIDNRLRRPELHELTEGRQKLSALVAGQWHRRLVAPLGLGIAQLEWAASVAATVRVACLHRPRHGMTIDEVAGLLETALGRGAPGRRDLERLA
jgi:hypothetical protein